MKNSLNGVLLAITLLWGCGAWAASSGLELSDTPKPYLDASQLPERSRPLLELGAPLLGSGVIPKGFELPTGAVWQPRLWVFGTARTALQYHDMGDADVISEWAHRLDLFANLQLSGTERVLLGLRPLDRNGKFTRLTIRPQDEDGWRTELDFNIETLFFEGDIGEIFPGLNTEDFGGGDIGFSVGRQPLFLQEGLLMDDIIDMVGLTQNSIRFGGVSNFLITAFFGLNEVNREDNSQDASAKIFGVHTRTDTKVRTWDIDAVYVDAPGDDDNQGDLLNIGISAVQRLGLWGISARALTSIATDNKSTVADDGVLLFVEANRTPEGTEDIFYLTGFWAIDEYTSAAREFDVGGPLGRAGILFAAPGIGSVGTALDPTAQEVVGGAIGYEKFINHSTQVTAEAGVRIGTDSRIENDYGLALRLQKGFGRRVVWQVDVFGVIQESESDALGLRTELLVKL